ncbi:hypothetical protein AA313_de0209414 [Arthrobotrys entomopaga]|nr:hypothetical protein AA313_de0209414 [Arthrobotrys entomopaga]
MKVTCLSPASHLASPAAQIVIIPINLPSKRTLLLAWNFTITETASFISCFEFRCEIFFSTSLPLRVLQQGAMIWGHDRCETSHDRIRVDLKNLHFCNFQPSPAQCSAGGRFHDTGSIQIWAYFEVNT